MKLKICRLGIRIYLLFSQETNPIHGMKVRICRDYRGEKDSIENNCSLVQISQSPCCLIRRLSAILFNNANLTVYPYMKKQTSRPKRLLKFGEKTSTVARLVLPKTFRKGFTDLKLYAHSLGDRSQMLLRVLH